jgi:hypothetical protein
MFDPNLPQENTIADAAQMRGQFQGLKALIDLLQTIATAQVDAVNTLPPGDPANVTVSVVGSTMHLTFDIPQGDAGAAGSDGAPGANGADGAQGPPGEVTLSQLDAAVATTSANSNAIPTMDTAFTNDPPTLADMEMMRAAYNDLVLGLRRA